jgi:hypothetical protein
MRTTDLRQLKPFFSVLFIVSTLLVLVFIKMEERRISYVVLKNTKEHKRVMEVQKQKEITLAKLTRPQLLENVATNRLTLKRVTAAQIIHLTAATKNSSKSERSP